MKRISDLSDEIRSFINEPEYHSLISLDDSGFKQLCSCLDLIGDTELALDAYTNLQYPSAIGEKYLALYGVLAAMRLQQDAVKHLSESLAINYQEVEELRLIRETIESIIFNATKKEINGVQCASGITQPTMSHAEITLWTLPTGANFKYKHIRILEIIQTQRNILTNALSKMLEELTQ